jgi:putative ABC transport system ATP-binding protein
MAGLDSPSQGEIWLADQDITAMTEEQRAKLRGREVGFIFQNFQLLPALTAQENVMLPMEVKELGKQAEQQAQLLLERVGLGERLHHYPKQLSGGEQQRVAIARAFASQARILFADEPTGNLDSRTGDYVAELLFELNREMNTTLVLVTHDRELAARCDRQVEIHAGRISDHEASH